MPAGQASVNVRGIARTQRVTNRSTLATTLSCSADNCSVCCVGVEVDRDADVVEAGMAVAEAEEGVKVDIAGELDAQVTDGDARHGGVRRVADGEAVAEGAEQLLDGIGSGVRATQGRRLVRRPAERTRGRGLRTGIRRSSEPPQPTWWRRRRDTDTDGLGERGDCAQIDVVQARRMH